MEVEAGRGVIKKSTVFAEVDLEWSKLLAAVAKLNFVHLQDIALSVILGGRCQWIGGSAGMRGGGVLERGQFLLKQFANKIILL